MLGSAAVAMGTYDFTDATDGSKATAKPAAQAAADPAAEPAAEPAGNRLFFIRVSSKGFMRFSSTASRLLY